jgi:hypothetical protein
MNNNIKTPNSNQMKPIKFLEPVSEWLMRSSVLLFAVLYYLSVIRVMNFSSVMFWISLGFFVFSILLFTGGFLRKTPLTVISAFALTLLVGYQSVIVIQAGVGYNFAVFVILGSILIHFIARGNNT